MSYYNKVIIPVNKEEKEIIRHLKKVHSVNIQKLFRNLLWESISNFDDFKELSNHSKGDEDNTTII